MSSRLVHHRLPPLALDVLLELDAERAVVPGRAGAAVDLAAGEDEPPALAEADDGVEAGFARELGGHGGSPSGWRSEEVERQRYRSANRPGAAVPASAARAGSDATSPASGSHVRSSSKAVGSSTARYMQRHGVQLHLVRPRAPGGSTRRSSHALVSIHSAGVVRRPGRRRPARQPGCARSASSAARACVGERGGLLLGDDASRVTTEHAAPYSPVPDFQREVSAAVVGVGRVGRRRRRRSGGRAQAYSSTARHRSRRSKSGHSVSRNTSSA